MKIGKLEFKEYAAKKPLAVDDATGRYLTARDIVEKPALRLGSLLSLDTETRVKLAVERYKLEPDFTLGVIGMGLVTKDEAIEHLKNQTEFGQLALEAEMAHCSELMAALAGEIVPAWPVIPKGPIPKVPDWKPIKRCIILKVPTRVLFCENTTDAVTTPFANYRMANVHPAFAAKGFSVVVLQGVDDVRANFVPQAKNTLTVYISGIGHGSYTVYTGHAGNRILEACAYDSAEVKDKAIHLLSCQTAKTLGPDTIAKGARAYAGYTENFVLQWDSSATPIDEFKLFAKCDSTFDLSMAAGCTAQVAFNSTVAAFNAAIASVPGTVTASYLTHDRDHLKLHGDPNTKIVPYRLVKVCFPMTALERQTALLAAGELVTG